jgi:hypothetical protein
MEPRNKRHPGGSRSTTGMLLDGKRVSPGKSTGHSSNVTYSVVDLPLKKHGRGDKRVTQRRRTRLRTGKITDLLNRFIVDCQLHDRSATGARIRLMGNLTIPMLLRFYDDELRTLDTAEVMWRDKLEVGLRFTPKQPMSRSDQTAIATLGGQYYALRL